MVAKKLKHEKPGKNGVKEPGSLKNCMSLKRLLCLVQRTRNRLSSYHSFSFIFFSTNFWSCFDVTLKYRILLFFLSSSALHFDTFNFVVYFVNNHVPTPTVRFIYTLYTYIHTFVCGGATRRGLRLLLKVDNLGMCFWSLFPFLSFFFFPCVCLSPVVFSLVLEGLPTQLCRGHSSS